MTPESAGAVQTALYEILSENMALVTLIGAGKVFDHVPGGMACPYVVIGDMESRPFDTQDASGNELSVDIHAYAQARGGLLLHHIMSAVSDALHDVDFMVAGQSLVLCRKVSTATRLEADGETRRGVSRFRIVTEV